VGEMSSSIVSHQIIIRARGRSLTLAGEVGLSTLRRQERLQDHAVQMFFIDLPEPLRYSPAKTFHLPARDVPLHETASCRVRLLVAQRSA